MPEGASPASSFASALLGQLVAGGVRHVVVAPGSRSQALALAAARLEQDERIRLHVRIDERDAGFLALGIAAETGAPVPVIVTSGTAVANLHPPMLEAWHSGVPLVALTADRPNELRGVGANQATRQPGIFGPAAVWSVDEPAPEGVAAPQRASALAREVLEHAQDGPVHVNLAFRDPLSGAAEAGVGAEAVELPERPAAAAERIALPERTVVLAGGGAGPAAEAFARAAGLPLIAEVTSGARFGPNLVPAYRAVLADPDLAAAIEQVVVFGRPTLSRELPALVARVPSVVVRRPGAEQFDPGRSARIVDALVLPDAPQDPAWLRAWILAGRRAAVPEDDVPYLGDPSVSSPSAAGRLARSEMAALRSPVTRQSLVEAVWRATWPHDRLVLGASRLIRDADRHVPGKRIRVHANRGLSGIDGTVATALGVAAGAGDDPKSAAGTTRVLLGDLTLLHDVGGLLLPPGERRPRVQLIVGNDGGGTIFDGLEVAATADRSAFDRVLFTPQEVDLAHLAAAYGWQHARATSRGDLDKALTAPPPGLSILEVPLPR
ncbi:2-succinyl-5-enolpyruvyl-6-hydroxy-3-cyclohexene-1-carboxylic-acid synthase [Naasia sp. SYSU D00057]|uniref:2-succinyl-5-enolpyruvyl-6-hydroxy-3- cyclohexene-1-carboxylic-acid synthase n=1 Tax=Naasia sp. SYSU D00057 TaxID=2817380 RepID=UPI001B310084|nr:2-succinyl-5-enolpyruvyl-6-hydroxy-3-cyclohexene-1-carboxylic-acid synthase [Naasia sp. SYSU D00057]